MEKSKRNLKQVNLKYDHPSLPKEIRLNTERSFETDGCIHFVVCDEQHGSFNGSHKGAIWDLRFWKGSDELEVVYWAGSRFNTQYIPADKIEIIREDPLKWYKVYDQEADLLGIYSEDELESLKEFDPSIRTVEITDPVVLDHYNSNQSTKKTEV